MPPAFLSVLVYMPGEAPLPTVHEGYIMPEGEWMTSLYGYRILKAEVTHWAEMPEFDEETVLKGTVMENA